VSHVVASIAWDPGFRGLLTVVVAVLVLCGSVYLLLGTNMGTRLGFMVALTGLFGWLFLMGIVWTIYGIGYKGPAPSWKVLEVNVGDVAQADTEVARSLPEPADLPDPVEVRDNSKALLKAFPTDKRDPTLGDLVTVDTALADQIKEQTGKWYLLPTSDKAVGETSAVVAEDLGPEGRNLFAETTDYTILEVYTTGGKPKRTDTSLTGRVKWKLGNALRLKNPPAYAVVQLQATVPQPTRPGQAPPTPVADPKAPVISVVLERDLGALRLPSFGFTVFSGIVFGLLCWMLHNRDREVARNRAAAGAS
jgi:hypothetical protein